MIFLSPVHPLTIVRVAVRGELISHMRHGHGSQIALLKMDPYLAEKGDWIGSVELERRGLNGIHSKSFSDTSDFHRQRIGNL